MRKFSVVFLILVVATPAVLAQSYVPEQNDTSMIVQPAIDVAAYAFNLEDVQLSDGVFKEAMQADVDYLKYLEPDRLLSQFRSHAGLTPKAERYGGWESMGLAGHSLGHYLSAISMHYAVTKDELFKERADYIVEELSLIQNKRGTGYVGAIPQEDSVFYLVSLGNIRSRGFDLNGAWAPWYTIHKIMAGLLDAYLYTGNQKALEVEIGIADWAGNVLRGLTYEEIQKMLLCEYGGMNEVLANTYALTGEEKYLELSYLFHDNFVMDSLAVQVNPLPGKHSNTQVPKVIGAARRYQLTGKESDYVIADYFWDVMVNHHTYAPGGNSNYEYLGAEDELNATLTDNTMETCNTHNMLKLTRHLFAIEPSATLMDYYERALYNHILASQNRENGMVCYFVPLRMGTKKEFSDEENSFTCCVGSGMENHVKYGESIYYKGNDGSLFVNLFIPSALNWEEQSTQITLSSNIPEEEAVSIAVHPESATEFTVRIRKPYWAESEIGFKVNGRTVKAGVDEYGYYAITRTWKKGDKITFDLPFTLHKETMPDNDDRMAFFYGPVMLAGDLGANEPDPREGIPVFVTDISKVENILKQRENKAVFATADVGLANEVTFRPFYEFTDDHYSVYWDVFDSEEWKTEKQKYEERKAQEAEILARTVDILRIGEMQPERDHELTGENTRVGEEHTKKFRIADNGGNFSFNLKVDAAQKNELILSYWGMDNRYRTFTILVDGEQIAEVDINRYKDSKFYDIHYPIPTELTEGKGEVHIALQAKPGNQAGPVYGIRMVRGE